MQERKAFVCNWKRTQKIKHKQTAKNSCQDAKLTRLKWLKYLHNALVSSLLRSTFCRLPFIQFIQLITSEHPEISNFTET